MRIADKVVSSVWLLLAAVCLWGLVATEYYSAESREDAVWHDAHDAMSEWVAHHRAEDMIPSPDRFVAAEQRAYVEQQIEEFHRTPPTFGTQHMCAYMLACSGARSLKF